MQQAILPLSYRAIYDKCTDSFTHFLAGELVDRSLDYIMSVLQSLPVGNFDGKSRFEGEPVVLWDEKRTASSVMYPYGPNIRIRFEQNKPYDPYRRNPLYELPVCHNQSSDVLFLVC